MLFLAGLHNLQLIKHVYMEILSHKYNLRIEQNWDLHYVLCTLNFQVELQVCFEQQKDAVLTISIKKTLEKQLFYGMKEALPSDILLRCFCLQLFLVIIANGLLIQNLFSCIVQLICRKSTSVHLALLTALLFDVIFVVQITN